MYNFAQRLNPWLPRWRQMEQIKALETGIILLIDQVAAVIFVIVNFLTFLVTYEAT